MILDSKGQQLIAPSPTVPRLAATEKINEYETGSLHGRSYNGNEDSTWM